MPAPAAPGTSSTIVVLPGDLLPGALPPGPGTHSYSRSTTSSLLGVFHPPTGAPAKKLPAGKPPPSQAQFAAVAPAPPRVRARPPPAQPAVGATVLARVLRVQDRQATLGIVAVDESPPAGGAADPTPESTRATAVARHPRPLSNPLLCPQPPGAPPGAFETAASWPGVVRREDVRATERDGVVMAESFRAGDVVRGVVVGVGEVGVGWYVSTAGDGNGVVLAWAAGDVLGAEGRGLMFPVSWNRVRDERTGREEGRKVARPV